MTDQIQLDEYIANFEKAAKECPWPGTAESYEKVCEWLKELKRLRSSSEILRSEKPITDENAIDFLRSTGWLQNHDKELTIGRTTKVIYHDAIITVNGYKYHHEEYLCDGCKKKVLGGDDYCSHCGAKLIWVDEDDIPSEYFESGGK